MQLGQVVKGRPATESARSPRHLVPRRATPRQAGSVRRTRYRAAAVPRPALSGRRAACRSAAACASATYSEAGNQVERVRAASSVHAFSLCESPLTFCAAPWMRHRVSCYSPRAPGEHERKLISGAQHRRPQIGMPLAALPAEMRDIGNAPSPARHQVSRLAGRSARLRRFD